MAERGEVLVTRLPLRLAVLLALLLGVHSRPAPAADAVEEKLPPSQKENYEVFKIRCSKCHPLARPLNTRMKPDAWKAYVEKMKRRPGSGISPGDGSKILEFLQYREAQRAYEAGEGPPPDAGTK